MNQTVVDDIAEQLDVLNEIPEVKKIIAEKQILHFNADYLNAEWAKIASAQAKDYPTYRSEYRVAKTLIRQRNQIIYQLKMPAFSTQEFLTQSPNISVNNVNVDLVLEKFVELSKLLTSLLKSVGNVFETEKTISISLRNLITAGSRNSENFQQFENFPFLC